MAKTPVLESKLPVYALQAGLAFVFLYAAYSSFVRPLDWIGYFPHYIRGFIPDMLMLQVFSAGEILLALWLLSGWKVYLAAIFSVIALLGITFTNLAVLDITFRDVGLAAAALALAFLTVPRSD
jgi:hypothetical protein